MQLKGISRELPYDSVRAIIRGTNRIEETVGRKIEVQVTNCFVPTSTHEHTFLRARIFQLARVDR